MDGVRLAPGGAIEHPLADKPIDAFDGETPPCHARCKNKAAGPNNVDPVEENLVPGGIDARDGTRDQNFGSKPPCLPKGAAGKLVGGSRPALEEPGDLVVPYRCRWRCAHLLAVIPLGWPGLSIPGLSYPGRLAVPRITLTGLLPPARLRKAGA